MKLVTFGEIVWDVYPDRRCIGGAPLNFAAHAAALGAEAYLVSAVGDDELGQAAREALHRFGVHDETVATVAYPTGQCRVTLDAAAVPQYCLLDEVAYDHLPAVTEPPVADALVFGTLIQRSENNRRVLQQLLAAGQFGEVFCDVNLRAPYYDTHSVEFCLQSATMLKISREELPALASLVFGDALADYTAEARRLATRYPQLRMIIITLDNEGAYVLDTVSGREYRRAAEPVTVVSTVGAGDSFGAAFLVTYFQTHCPKTALEAAVRRSAYVVAHAEAVPTDD